MARSDDEVPFVALSLNNGVLLSGLYLLLGAAVEVVRRVLNPRWAEAVAFRLEAFPAGLLEVLGLLTPLRRAYAQGELSGLQVRAVYGLTVVVVVLLLGLVVGWAMTGVARLAGRRTT